MSKRKVDESENMALDDEKQDVVMAEAMSTAAGTAATANSEDEQHHEGRDYSSLFEDVAFDASLQQSCLSVLKKAYARAKTSRQNWDEMPATQKLVYIARQITASIQDVFGGTPVNEDWFDDKLPVFLEIHEKRDVVDRGLVQDLDIAQSAFELNYTIHPDDTAFLQHLETQRTTFLERKEKGTNSGEGGNAPFFAVIQSSGYGKSRLVSQILDGKSGDYDAIYWSFASDKAYPPKNVTIAEASFQSRRREALEKAFQVKIRAAINAVLAGGKKQTGSDTVIAALPPAATPTSKPPALNKKIIFVVDEASELLRKFTSDGVSYYRALRTAFKMFASVADKLFFVVMATFSSITYLSPGLAMDPSFKPYSGYDDENQKPLEPFILGSSFRVNNDRSALLDLSVEECHQPECLYSMGRPLWKALLTCTNPMNTESLLEYARMKLRNSNEKHSELTKKEEILAVLSVRLCLSISPTCLYVPSLVACHMGTALHVSEDRMSMVVTYPSEPVLAVGAKIFTKNMENTGRMISALQDFLTHGDVDKGYKGDLIVRFLMTLAMDKAMGSDNVKEVKLRDYLACFNRDGANIGEVINGLESSNGEELDVEKELDKLKRLNLDWSDSRAILESKKQDQTAAVFKPLPYASGSVCFTHFVYLSKSADGPLITHDLLRYAYRRSAAIVVEEGRRGIDKVIPLRVANDQFVGLVVQDKNRVSVTLQSLTSVDNEVTHHKVNVEYFLTEDEKKTFRSAGVDLEKHWPAILFAIGVDEVGADVATQLEQKRFRHNSLCDTERFDFPCIVLAGLSYSNLMDEVAVARLKELRDFEVVPTNRKQGDIPITYGS